ncbi:hypothetical protein, partial [Mycobacterium sp.]|uniref:hypothetical protein n=1 Tax=Mycobacterium sp. TaxID=1785 RepID=UPI003C736D8F
AHGRSEVYPEAYITAQQEMGPASVKQEVDFDFMLSGEPCDGRRVPRGRSNLQTMMRPPPGCSAVHAPVLLQWL